ncbi:MAG: hypothetical protein AB8B50_15505 [Pirellulaceae bacterium]
MARNNIIDWQDDSILVASVANRGGSGTIESLSMQSVDHSRSDGLSAALAVGVQEANIGKGPVTVVAGRSIVEVRTIKVPRLDADELPEIIRFQAQRQLANMGDGWTLDFVMLPDTGQEMQTALVSAIAPARIEQIQAACTAANLTIQHVALRPLEVARQAVAQADLRSGTAMTLCVSEQGADLIFTTQGQTVLLRHTKLLHDGQLAPQAVAGELRRSMLAAATELGELNIQKAVVFAASEHEQALTDAVQDATQCPIHFVDLGSLLPADNSEVAKQGGSRVVGACGASLLGSADKATFIDFQDPKKRRPPKSRTKEYILAAIAAVLVIGAGITWWVRTNNDLDSQLEMLTLANEEKEELVERAKTKATQLAEVESFTNNSVQFLDEFARACELMPGSENIMMAGPTFTTLSDGTAKIVVNIAADESSSISKFEQSLRSDDHTVSAKQAQESREPTALYKWVATQTIEIRNRGWDIVENLSTSSRASSAKPITEKSDAESKSEATAAKDSDQGQPQDAAPAEQETKDSQESSDQDETKTPADSSKVASIGL